MNTTTLLRLGRIYATEQGLSLTTVGKQLANAGAFFVRLEQGHDVTLRRANLIVQRLSDRWPPNAEWPSDIPRPAPVAASSETELSG